MDQSADAWTMARLGNAIDSYVDRQLNSPQMMTGQTGYGIDQYGALYPLGQPATQQQVAAVQARPNYMLLLLIAGGIYLATQ